MVTRVSEQIHEQNNSSNNRSIFGTVVYNAKVYDLVGNGTTNDYSALNSLLTTIGSAQATILFPVGTYKISSNITIPSNVCLWFVKGAMISPDSGKTITINGPIEAGLWQIFTGSGTIVGTPQSDEFYLQWWGGIGDSATDNTAALAAAVAAVPEGGVLTIPNGQYNYTSLEITRSIKIRGTPNTGANATTTNGTVLMYNGSGTEAIYISKQNVSLEHLYVLNESTSTIDGIVVNGVSAMSCIEFSHVTTNGFKNGFSVAMAFLVNFNYCRAANASTGFNVYNCDTTVNFHKCWALICSDKGYHIKDLAYSNLINCAADQCKNSYYFENCNGVSLYNCGSEVSTDINIFATNSTMGFYGCKSYRNNSSLTDTVSFAKFEDSFITFNGCYETDLYSLSNNRSVLLDNTIINMHGSNVRFAVATVGGDTTSRVFGAYNKDGGIANDVVGNLTTAITQPNGPNLNFSNLSDYVNGLINQETTRYISSNINTVSYNRVSYLTSLATGNPVPGEHTAIYPVYQDTEIFYIAVAANRKMLVGYSSNSGSTITWRKIQDVESGTTAARPTANLVTGQQYFDTTLNKPIWRNTANTGWVDATGTTV
jgi:hypothetical protein